MIPGEREIREYAERLYATPGPLADVGLGIIATVDRLADEATELDEWNEMADGKTPAQVGALLSELDDVCGAFDDFDGPTMPIDSNDPEAALRALAAEVMGVRSALLEFGALTREDAHGEADVVGVVRLLLGLEPE